MNRNRLVNQDTVNALLRTATLFTVLSFLLPLATLILRIVDFEWLQKHMPGPVVINPLSAITHMIAAVAIWLVRKRYINNTVWGIKNKTISNVLCLIIMSIGLGRIIFRILDWPFIIDELLFTDQLVIPDSLKIEVDYNSMAINTGFCYFLLGLSIIFIDYGKNTFYKSAQTFNYIIIFIAILSIYGFIYNVGNLYSSLGRIPMSSIAATCLLLQSTAVLFYRPYQGTISHLIGQNPTNVFLIRGIAFIIPLIIGYLRIKGEEFELYNEKFGTVLIGTFTYIISMSLLGWKSNIQYKLQLAKSQKLHLVKKERKRMQRILDTSPSIIQIFDLDKNKITFSNKHNQSSSKEKDKIMESTYDELLEPVHPDDMEKLSERYPKLKKLKKDEYDDVEFRVVDQEGNTRWFFNRAMVYSMKNDKVDQILLNSIDITKEKETEKALRKKQDELKDKHKKLEKAKKELDEVHNKLKKWVKEEEEELVKSEKLYHDYIRNSFDGIVEYAHKEGDIDLDQSKDKIIEQIKEQAYIKEANQTIADMYGYKSPKELAGMLFTDFVRDIPEDALKKNMEKFLESDYRIFGYKPVFISQEGKKVETYINLLGIVKDNKLVKVWDIHSQRKIREIKK